MINKETCLDYLAEDSAVTRAISSYEARDGQGEMADSICDAFNEDKIAVIEAGTGIGKSFAYLIPAIMWSQLHPDDHIIISTATINLQQQLFEKDLPFLADKMDPALRFSLLMGRNNYLCLKSMEQQIQDNPLLIESEGTEIGRIYDWSRKTRTGMKHEMTPSPEESVWRQVCSESDTCLGYRCEFYSQCFVYKARKKAALSQITVVNHHVLFADISLKYESDSYEEAALLPPFDHVICDEAHHLEHHASQYFSDQYTILGLYKILSIITNSSSQKRSNQIMSTIQKYSSAADEFKKVDNQAKKTKASAEKLDDLFTNLLGKRKSMWLDPNLQRPFTEIQKALINFADEITSLRKILEKIHASVDEDEEIIFQLYVFHAQIIRLEKFEKIIKSFSSYKEQGDTIFWIDTSLNRNTKKRDAILYYHRTPKSIAGTLYDSFFSRMKTIVNTSATMSVNKQFSYWKEPLGLNTIASERILEKIISSPFDYKKRVLLAVPVNAPPVQELQKYTEYLEKTLQQLVETAEGKTLILFTSFSLLNALYDALKKSLPQDFTILKQIKGSNRQLLLETFKQAGKNVLLATESFWEGVDIPGDALKQVVITRLPFQVPTDPVYLAKEEDLKNRGRYPFMDLALPRASLKLKQGFGRLMRKTDDHGIVCILDNRIVKKQYGALLLNSLPETLRSIKENEHMISDIENFLYQ